MAHDNPPNDSSGPSGRSASEPAASQRSNSPGTSKLWGGRFSEATDEFVQVFTASVNFDARMASQDIRGSLAHAAMLQNVGVLSADDAAQIRQGLDEIHDEIAAGEFHWQVPLEDVHMNVESRLIELIGDVGKKLHTGRSRNDQVATDLRLFLREAIDEIDSLEAALQNALLDQAERYAGVIMPGFTHLQSAQPVTFGHHLLAWFEMLTRDRERLADCRKRVNVLPLGSAALAGTTFPIDRAQVAATLGFDAVSANSLDGVSDRDFAIEFCAVAALTMNHFSRWCEELVLWASQQFNFVDLPDRFCTGSSIMPQKKNPDVPELIRGKSGRVTGDLISLLTLMKGQPLAYNKDNQEDKEPLFDAVDTLRDCLTALVGLIPAIKPNQESMRTAAASGFATATDLADYLVRGGIAFRDAHHIVGQTVALALAQGKELHQLTLDQLQDICQSINPDVYEILTLEGSVNARRHVGGTAPETVRSAAISSRARVKRP